MATRRVKTPQNLTAAREKNVRDPGEHPLGMADSPEATARRKKTAGDAHMRLPHEHDETADVQERAAGVDKLLEQARRDAESGQVDTDRRSDAVETFNRGTDAKPRKR